MNTTKKKLVPRSKLTTTQKRLLKEAIREMLGPSLTKPEAPTEIIESMENTSTNIFLKYAINSRFLNQES